MKLFHRICLISLVFALMLSFVCPSAAQEENGSLAVSKGCSTLDAAVAVKSDGKLLPTARGAVLFEMNTDTMVYSWQADEKLDPSGMNKLMTALLAIEAGDLEAKVTVTSEALSSLEPGSVSAGLKSGEELTLRDLLFCMMVGSANDAAAVIAQHIAGNQEAFVARMNAKATELGCANTCFLNPTGLSSDGQYSTARDLAKITAAALKNDVFSELFSAVTYTVPATNVSEERVIHTTNYLMSREVVKNQFDSRVTGGKTGALSTRDRSVICTAEAEGKRYLAVVMSAQSTLTANGLSVVTFGNFEEARILFDHGFNEYSQRQLLMDDMVLTRFPVTDGENDVAVRADGIVTAMIPKDMSQLDVRYEYTQLQGGIAAPVTEGQVVGTVEVWFRSVCVGQCDLIAMHDVNEPGIYDFAITPGGQKAEKLPWKLLVLILLVVVLGGVLLLGLVLTVIRWIRGIKTKYRHTKRRKNRQRSR